MDPNRDHLWLLVEAYPKLVASASDQDREYVLRDLKSKTIADALRAGMNEAQAKEVADQTLGRVRALVAVNGEAGRVRDGEKTR